MVFPPESILDQVDGCCAQATMGCRHLLIKYSGSRNPVSRRTGQSTAEVSAEAAQVCHFIIAHPPSRLRSTQAELNQYIEKINAEGCTEDVFAKYAAERSDCGSCRDGGNLGTFGPGEMQSQFEEGTRATEVGKMSGIVHSDSGFHIIYRTA